jgi:hypothetical protein
MKSEAAQRNWEFNLIRALASECIFANLRIVTFNTPASGQDIIIIKWLEVRLLSFVLAPLNT